MSERLLYWSTTGLILAAILGCKDPSPKAYRVSGTVTLDGQPIPFGEVIFTPDAEKRNSGPQGIAEIHDGKFDTRAAGGKGVAGGPTVIQVNGMSAPGGRTLCEYELKTELPRQDTTQEIAVPKRAAAKAAPEI